MPESDSSISKEPLGIVDYIVVLLKRKHFIIWFSSLICVISIILYFFVFDLIYYSSATIKSSGKQGGLLLGLDNLTDFGGLGDLGIGGSSTKELAYYVEVLNSRRCIEKTIIHFNIMENEEYVFMEDAIKNFRTEKLKTEIDKQSGLLFIGIYDKNPLKAKEIVDYLIDELNKINIELSIQNAKNNREFIETRYYTAKNELMQAEDTLKQFQSIYGVAPDLQIKASVQSLYVLETELKSEEVKLDVLKKILSNDEPEVKIQIEKVNSLKNQIEEIKRSTDPNELLALGNSPNIAINYLRLQRNIEIQSKILTFILPIYEQSKIEEKRETPTILVLDKPFIAEKKTKPKRLTMVLLSTFISMVFISFLVILYDVHIRKILITIKNRKIDS